MEPKSVLFIRIDNIGDLICTTAAIRAFRQKYPAARVGILVNSYNAEAIRGNPDIDTVYVYEKEKHARGKGRLGVMLGNLGVLLKIRSAGFEASVACGYSFSRRLARYAWMTGAKVRIGYVSKKDGSGSYTLPLDEPDEPVHEVEAMMKLLEPFGVAGKPPSLFLKPDAVEVEKARKYLVRAGFRDKEPLIAFHISSRKPQNRWPRERFRELGEMIGREFPGARIMLLWSPGKSDNPLHPGDDERAEWILTRLSSKPLAYRTETLNELAAALSLASVVVCCDGGAMHMAAALGKPILTVWGSTDKRRWAPWGVKNIVLQKENGGAQAVTAQEAMDGFRELYGELVNR